MKPLKYSMLTMQERRKVREQYIAEQKGLCFYCKEPLSGDPNETVKAKEVNWSLFPPNFLRHPVHLQHDHETDLTEGAVHALCNAVMWEYEGR